MNIRRYGSDFIREVGKFVALSFFCAIFVSLVGNVLEGHWYESDIRAFYTASLIVRNNPRKLYDFSLQQNYQHKILKNQYGVLAFINPPIALLPYIPFSYLDPANAYRWFSIFLFVLTVVVCYFLRRFYDGKTRASVFQYLVPLTFVPLSFLITESQNALWYLLILTLMLYLTKRRQLFSAGCIAAFMWYKPQLAPLISFFILLCGPKSMRSGFISGLVLFVGINVVMAGGEWRLFTEKFLWYSTVFESSFEYLRFMVSWQGLIEQVSHRIPGLPVYGISLFVSGVTYLISIVACLRLKTFSERLSYGLPVIVTGTLLGGMHIHYQEAILLIYLFYRYYKKPVTGKLILLTALGWMTFLFTYYSPVYPKPFPYLPTLYIVLLWVLCTREAFVRGKDHKNELKDYITSKSTEQLPLIKRTSV